MDNDDVILQDDLKNRSAEDMLAFLQWAVEEEPGLMTELYAEYLNHLVTGD